MMLAGKRLLVTGVLTEDSIAYAIAERAQQEGAELVLTGFDRGLRITRRIARRLPAEPPVLELDVNEPDHIAAVADDLRERWNGLDGVVHAIAFAPQDALGGRFLEAPAASAEFAFRTSAYSLAALAGGLRDLLAADGGGAVVGLTFDGSVAWPLYDWMGVAKGALESVNRYLARDLGAAGVRSNLVAAGPLRTLAARSIPGFDALAAAWERQAPLGWELTDAGPVADACLFLLSDYSRSVTGEVLHVDGGFHAVGAPPAEAIDQPD